METSDGVRKKPFKATGLLNKSQLKLASYIKAHNDVTLHGTKRFTDKSGEYYLKNVQLQNSKQDPTSNKKNSLNTPQNIENCLNSMNFGKIKRRASKIVTLLPENSLTPIPKKDGINRLAMANGYGKKELKNAERTAVFIRRMEYATSMKRQMQDGRNMKNQNKKIILIQNWWKTMYKIIKLQKNVRGFLFRKKLMNNLEHQEKLLQFITEFDNIHNYHLYRNFMDNLKKKRDFEKAKLMEKCEDFNERLDNLEKMRNLRNLKSYFETWKKSAIRRKKISYEKFTKRLTDLLTMKVKKNNLNTLRTIKDHGKSEEDLLDDKAKDFQERKAKENFMRDLIRAHRLNKFLNNAKNKIDDRLKKEAFDKLKRNDDIAKAAQKLQKIFDDKMKKKAWDDMKTMDFVDKVDDAINKHNDKINDEAKKEFLDKLKDLSNKNKLRDKLRNWKGFNDEMKNRKKILDKLRRYKENELRKKAEEEKKKLQVDSGVNDFEVVSDKKPDDKNKNLETSGGQNFSLTPGEKFKFGDPDEKRPKPGLESVKDQLNDLNLAKNKNNLEKAVERLNYLMNEKPKKDAFDTLKKNAAISEGCKVLDKLFKNKADDLKKEAINALKQNLDNLKNNNIGKACDLLDKFMDHKLQKDTFNDLKKMNNLGKACEKLDKLISDKLKDDTLKKLKTMQFVDILDKMKKKLDDKENLRTLMNNLQKIKNGQDLDKLRKAFDHWKNLRELKHILCKTKKNKTLGNTIKKVDNNILREYFDKWKDAMNPMSKLSDYEKNYLLDKYKHKMMQVLLNIYLRQRHLLVKRYLDRWRNAKNAKDDDDDEPKYKKKPKIGDDRDFTDSDKESFRPTYYNPKKNRYNKRRNQNSKKYTRNEEFNYYEVEKDQFSDTSSESVLGNGIYLTQVKKVISRSRNYTSQSFFIDKNVLKTTYQSNSNNPNQLPMTMKGDFISLIQKNPKILTQKNPRIQVTNATCDLNEIVYSETTEDELITEQNKYENKKNNFNIDRNKVLSKVIKNCDKDLYAAQKPFRVKKDQWYSVSIPLKNNEARWEFLNNIKGEREKNTLNKFELIQKEPEPKKEEGEEENPYNTKTFRTDKKRTLTRDTSYKLREMNYSQFYRSPMKVDREFEDDKSLMSNKINRIRRPGQNTYMNSSYRSRRKNNNFGSNNIDRSRGKIELDPKYRSIEYECGEFNESDD